MMASNSNSFKRPDFLFEVSWEVCNKVGGIHTVISTKAPLMRENLGDDFIQIGPDIFTGAGGNSEFLEAPELLKEWKNQFNRHGLKVRVGRWNIPGNSLVILIDFSPLFSIKDQIFTELWVKNRLDSLQGGWDYIEPALFGYAAGVIIEDYKNFYLQGKPYIIAHFHEWMTGAGVLYLENEVQGVTTVFTTHATVTGRILCGAGQPFYGKFDTYNGDQVAKDFNVIAKHSLEKATAVTADAFTTVSENTACECQQLLGKAVDKVTPNGFDDSYLPEKKIFDEKRGNARKTLIKVASCVLNSEISDDCFLIATSGRYEYRNKGIDLFLDSLSELLHNENIGRPIVAFILVPASHTRPRSEVLDCLRAGTFVKNGENNFLTHYLQDDVNDLICQKLKSKKLTNFLNKKVKVIFAPIYLDGRDGVFNETYYDMLIGFDLTIFPSYYEPFGYTPLESLSFSVPSVTTTLTGFGTQVKTLPKSNSEGMLVIERLDFNDQTVVDQIANHIYKFSFKSNSDITVARNNAFEISRNFLWKQLINNYYEVYAMAMERRNIKEEGIRRIQEIVSFSYMEPAESNEPVWKSAMVKFKIPKALQPLEIISKNMWWTWHPEVEDLFISIDRHLWDKVQGNPISFLNSLAYERFLELEKDSNFMNRLNKVFLDFNTYVNDGTIKTAPKIAFLCMEYALHQSLPIYAGGLGILAGDMLKEASDMNLDFLAFGILYRYGYFKQSLTLHGEQVVEYEKLHFTQLPIHPVEDENGKRMILQFPLRGPIVYVQVWRLDVGRIPLYLFDTDIPENGDEIKRITHHLYEGDRENRLRQELLIAAMTIQLLDRLNISPDLFHFNEGHTSFTNLIRIMKLVSYDNLSFEEAKQYVKASSLFTTHTPVPEAQDEFEENLLRSYQSHLADSLNVAWEHFLGLGKVNPADRNEKFSMNYLAAKLSGEINAVSEIHARVTKKMFKPLYKGLLEEELDIDNITNGVHYASWTARQWQELFENTFDRNFLKNIANESFWPMVKEIPSKLILEIKKELKKVLLDGIQNRLKEEVKSLHLPPTRIYGFFNSLSQNDLIIGFARRFATYKRATLLFNDIERLAKIVNNPSQPVKFIFAGKAHPIDKEAQNLITKIIEFSEQPQFSGKILFIQNYDMDLARLLVQGVDVWLSTPQRGKEASGTSGMKAALNGTINFGVMDGWWAEAYKPELGWGLTQERMYENQKDQDELDTETLFNILENEIIPEFFEQENGVKEKWANRIKNAFAYITPRYNTSRMMLEYRSKYYEPMFLQIRQMKEKNFELTKKFAEWIQNINREWSKISVVSLQVSETSNSLELGEKFRAEIVLNIGKISANDIGVELVLAKHFENGNYKIRSVKELQLISVNNQQALYKGELTASFTGAFHYSLRFFPKSILLKKRRNLPLINWV